MDIVGSVLGLGGVVLAAIAWIRVENLERKLRKFDVIPGDYHSLDNPK